MSEIEGGAYKITAPMHIMLTPARIAFDEDAVRAKVENLTQWYTDTTQEVLATMKPNEVRSCRSDLISIKKDVEDARKVIKREYLKPLNDFEARVKDIETAIDTPLEIIRTFISEQEEARRTERYRDLEELYEAYAGKIADVVPFDKFVEKEWMNKGCFLEHAESAIEGKVIRIANDIAALDSLQLNHRTAVIDAYADSLDLATALCEETRLNVLSERVDQMNSRKIENAEFVEYEMHLTCTMDAAKKICRFLATLNGVEKYELKNIV